MEEKDTCMFERTHGNWKGGLLPCGTTPEPRSPPSRQFLAPGRKGRDAMSHRMKMVVHLESSEPGRLLWVLLYDLRLMSEFLWVTCSKPQGFIAFTTTTASLLKNFQFGFLKTGSFYVAQAELEFLIFLPQSPECCHQRHTWLEHHHFHLSPENIERKPIKGLYGPSTSKQQGRTQIKMTLTQRSFF